ncbi:MAG: hypothetical protein ABIR37_04080 [Candidatus Saccharimonadales bacterium]
MESFREMVARERQQQDTTRTQEVEAVCARQESLQRAAQLAVQVSTESKAVAEALHRQGIVPNVAAMNKNTIKDIISSAFPAPKRNMGGVIPYSSRQLAKQQMRFEQAVRGRTFPVWELGTSWRITQPDEPWDDIYSEVHVLSSEGALYNKGVWSDDGPIGVEPLDLNAHLSEARFNTIRQGLAKLAAKHGVEV